MIIRSLFAGLLLFLSSLSFNANAQWPKIVNGSKGGITIYQLQPEAVSDSNVSGRCPVSIKYKPSDDFV
ncbi:MAG: hypothetical protein H7259_01890, partial [Cytophagales bacterium]|nr:hypothetical protein [Cytophaga sp.]